MKLILGGAGHRRRGMLVLMTALLLALALVPAAAQAWTWRGGVNVGPYSTYYFTTATVTGLNVATPNYGPTPNACAGIGSLQSCYWIPQSNNASWVAAVITTGRPWVRNNSGSTMYFDWYTP
jgi:hypothetical protein